MARVSPYKEPACSSSCEADSRFGRFLALSLSLLDDEKPGIVVELDRMMASRLISMTIDGVEVRLRFEEEGARVWEPAPEETGAPFIELESDRGAILDVVDGNLTLEDAVWQRRIELRGAVADLVLFHDALVVYLQGAVRSPSFPRLLDNYRRETETRALEAAL